MRHREFGRAARKPPSTPNENGGLAGRRFAKRWGGSPFTLGELEAAARLRAAILLAFHRARIAGEEAARLEHGAQGGLVIDQGARNAVTHRAGLARKPATIDGDDDIKLAVAAGRNQRLAQDHAQD